MRSTKFEWDSGKDEENVKKHHVSFFEAQAAFADPQRVIAKDVTHSLTEERFYCFGKVGPGILTVRFTYRRNAIRLFGAGYWRKGKVIYEQENDLQR